MDPRLLIPGLLGAFIIWAVIRRIRRTVGRQPVQPARLIVRIVMLAVIGSALLLATVHDVRSAGSLTLGVAAGGALGWLGLRHTIFEQTTAGRFYTPHTYIGVLVTLLFVGRIVYRFAMLNYDVATTVGATPSSVQNAFGLYQRSPLTVGLFGLLIGYYLVFNVGVMSKSRYTPVPTAD